jgi:hypothetical protein
MARKIVPKETKIKNKSFSEDQDASLDDWRGLYYLKICIFTLF